MIVNLTSPTTLYLDRSDTLVKYYEEIRKYQVLTPSEESALFNQLRNGSKEEQASAREKLGNCNQRFVLAVAKKYATQANIMDLISEGNIGLIKAIDTFEPSKNVKFITWAVWYIRRAINAYNMNYGKLVRQTNTSQTYYLSKKIKGKFEQENDRLPTNDELMDLLADEGVKISNSTDVINTNIFSIDENLDCEGGDIYMSNISEYNSVSASTNAYESVVDKDWVKDTIKGLITCLKPKEQTVICMMYGVGYEREYTPQEIADETGYTPERVRQMRTEILNKLKKRYKSVLG